MVAEHVSWMKNEKYTIKILNFMCMIKEEKLIIPQIKT